VVETDGAEGFERGRNLHKLGMEGQDTSELFFNDVKVPPRTSSAASRARASPADGQLPQERLNIAVQGVAAIERGLEQTMEYVKERKAFGKSILEFQNTQFVLAEARPRRPSPGLRRPLHRPAPQGQARRRHRLDGQVLGHRHGGQGRRPLPAAVRRLRLYERISDRPAVQGRRVQRIYGGTNEIMKVLIARTL
jgi:acyl-CoA dehydrogenase